MEPWRNYSSLWYTKVLPFFFLLVATLGLASAINQKREELLPFLIPGFVAFIALASDVPGLQLINESVRNYFPALGEAFRFAFTKFSILFVLCYTIFLALGIQLLSRWSARLPKISSFIPIFIASLLILYALPAFRGNFLFDSLRSPVQSDHLQTIEFFKNEDAHTRIAVFPQPNFWSWRFHDNGYRGSGFLWYGIEQPTLDRAFDPWSSKNENYYWEVSYALYSQDQSLFEKILEKYSVSWILIDKNVINPSSPKALYLNELEQILTSSKFSLSQTFGNIQIYKVNLETPGKDFIFLAQNLPTVGPIYNWNNLDTAYFENGNYISGIGNWELESESLLAESGNSIYYPFRSLATSREQKDIEFQVEEIPTSFVLKSKIPLQLQNYRVEIPKADSQDLLAFPQRAYMKNGYLYLLIPKVGSSLAKEVNPAMLELPSCVKSKNGIVELTSNKGATCSISVPLETLPHNVSYLIAVKNHNVKGKPIVFWLENLNSRKADIETNLPANNGLTESFFIQPPMDPFGRGYSLHFDNISIGKEEVINILSEIEIQPLPFNFLRSIKLVLPAKTPSVPITITNTIRSQASLITNVTHPNPAFYEIILGSIPKSTTLVLPQSFDKGWKAYEINSKFKNQKSNLQMLIAPILGRELKEHILVNNWANGWQLDESQTNKSIVILYLPQYLEFAGFLLLFGFGISLVMRKSPYGDWRRRTTLPLQ